MNIENQQELGKYSYEFQLMTNTEYGLCKFIFNNVVLTIFNVLQIFHQNKQKFV